MYDIANTTWKLLPVAAEAFQVRHTIVVDGRLGLFFCIRIGLSLGGEYLRGPVR